MLNFYCEVLGATIENEQVNIHLTQLRVGQNLIDLVEVSEKLERKSINLEHFCLRITPFDYDALKSYFSERGIELHRYGRRYGSQGMGYSFYLQDPEGNEVELCEFKENA